MYRKLPLDWSHQCLFIQLCSSGVGTIILTFSGQHIGSKYVHCQNLSHLRIPFERFSQHGVIVNQAGCQFEVTTIDVLGRQLSKDGSFHSCLIQVFKFLWYRCGSLQEFLGMVNLCRYFILKANALIQELFALYLVVQDFCFEGSKSWSTCPCWQLSYTSEFATDI